MSLCVRELTPELWPALERLFGQNGACGGCWCMYWRQRLGERWEDVKGEEARRRLHGLVEREEAHGVLAFDGDTPVGWCAFGRRPDFAKLHRAPSFACGDGEAVWSIPCFFVARTHRRKGVGRALLRGALEALRQRGARVVEAYPVRPAAPGKALPAAFAWTGTRALFDAEGFTLAGNEAGGKQRVRRTLG